MSTSTALRFQTVATFLLFTTTALAKKTVIKKQKQEPSFVSKLLPILALLIVVGVLAAIGFVVLQTVQNVQGNVQSQLDKNHIKISKDGAQVAYEGMSYEEYRDKTQGYNLLLLHSAPLPFLFYPLSFLIDRIVRMNPLPWLTNRSVVCEFCNI